MQLLRPVGLKGSVFLVAKRVVYPFGLENFAVPKPNNGIPKYSLHKPSGRAVVKFAGKPHYLGEFESDESRSKYDRLIAEYLACGRNANVLNASLDDEQTVLSLTIAFWEFTKSYYRKGDEDTSEVSSYRTVIRTLNRIYGDLPVNSFGPRRLKAVRELWLEKGLARSKINRHQRRLVRMFRWSVSEELVDSSTWEALRSVEGLRKGRTSAAEPVPVPPVSLDQIERTMPHLSEIVRDMIRMQLLTGMRPGEVVAIKPADIDRSGDVWEFRVDGHKTEHHGRDRTVYIGPQAKSILGPYLFRDANSHCFSPAESMEWHRADRSSR